MIGAYRGDLFPSNGSRIDAIVEDIAISPDLRRRMYLATHGNTVNAGSVVECEFSGIFNRRSELP